MKLKDNFVNNILNNDNNFDARNIKCSLARLAECLNNVEYNNQWESRPVFETFTIVNETVGSIGAFFQYDIKDYFYDAFWKLYNVLSEREQSRHGCLVFDLYYTAVSSDIYSSEKALISFTFDTQNYAILLTITDKNGNALSANTHLFGTITFAYDGWKENLESGEY